MLAGIRSRWIQLGLVNLAVSAVAGTPVSPPPPQGGAAQPTDVLTYHNDNARTGQALNEQILTPANVNATHFGKLWVLNTDGAVDAQPLYAAGVSIPGLGTHNVLFVATENDSVYAFDADSANVFWQASLLGSGEGPSDSRGCYQVTPQIGITATPVIDRQLGSNGMLFAVAMSMDNFGNYYQRLHALDLATGVETVPPVTISAIFPGTGDNSTGGYVIFDPAQYKERCGLLLLNGIVYTAWASHCDHRPYTAWVMGYDEAYLSQMAVLNLTPNGSQGGIWMANGGLAADEETNIYLLDGNGSFGTTLDQQGMPSNQNFGNAFLKISAANDTLTPTDYFATYNNIFEAADDTDLGSGGTVVLPDMIDAQGTPRQLAVGAGKDANIYLVDRYDMGGFNASGNAAIYQEIAGALAGVVASTPACFNNTLYYCASGDHLKAFPFQNALLGSVSSQSDATYVYPGATPSISANGDSDGIVWTVQNSSPACLYAHAATDLRVQLYASTQAPDGRDNFGSDAKFITPTIASARVYVGTQSGVAVFGFLDPSTLTPLEAWRNLYFGNPSNVGEGANNASPAGDGVPNLVKYALGLNPLVPMTADQMPFGSIQQSGGQPFLVLTVPRQAEAPDVTYLVEVSGDLQTWVNGWPNTATLTDIPTSLVVRDNTPVPSAAARFMRLQITNP